MGYRVTATYNGSTRVFESSMSGGMSITNGSYTGSIQGSTTKVLNCKNKYMPNNIGFVNGDPPEYLNCAGKYMIDNITLVGEDVSTGIPFLFKNTLPTGGSSSINVDFYSNGNTYSLIRITSSQNSINPSAKVAVRYNNTTVYSDGWKDSNYRFILITSGSVPTGIGLLGYTLHESTLDMTTTIYTGDSLMWSDWVDSPLNTLGLVVDINPITGENGISAGDGRYLYAWDGTNPYWVSYTDVGDGTVYSLEYVY